LQTGATALRVPLPNSFPASVYTERLEKSLANLRIGQPGRKAVVERLNVERWANRLVKEMMQNLKTTKLLSIEDAKG
jgi:hypothetical protein